MFNFRIINTPDGNQVIDKTLKTPFSSLTPFQMVEYTEIDNQLAIMDILERKIKAETEGKRKIARNPLHRLACLCGLF